jgi:hypothetical protein
MFRSDAASPQHGKGTVWQESECAFTGNRRTKSHVRGSS